MYSYLKTVDFICIVNQVCKEDVYKRQGTIYKLHQSRFPVLVLEIANPSCIRRTISFCEAVFDKEVEVEGVIAKRADSLEEAFAIYEQGQIPVMIDENGSTIETLHPPVVIDAILAKKNLGTKITDAPVAVSYTHLI